MMSNAGDVAILQTELKEVQTLLDLPLREEEYAVLHGRLHTLLADLWAIAKREIMAMASLN
jgi:hypothetical protein